MEPLFSTTLTIDNQIIVYRVYKDDDKYSFITEAENNDFPVFSLTRRGEDWNEQEFIGPDLKKQAVEALDKFGLQNPNR